MALMLLLLATPIASAVALIPGLKNSLSNSARLLAAGDGDLAVEKKNASLQVLDLLNAYRTSLGLSNLTWSEEAYNLAKNHTIYMINQGTISHDDFDSRAASYRSANENVAMFTGGSDADAAAKFFDMWKNSPGHDANMRSTSVTYDGTSIYLIKNAYYSTMFNMKPSGSVTPPQNTTTNTTTNNTTNTTTNTTTNNTTTNTTTNTTSNTTANTAVNTTTNAPVEKLEIGKQVFALLNTYRSSKNLKTLTWSDAAYKLAAGHTLDMVNAKTISHDGFDTRAKNFASSNENVAMFSGSNDSTAAAKFMDMWTTSDGHRANMLSTTVTQDAVSVYFDPKNPKSYYSTMFNDTPKK